MSKNEKEVLEPKVTNNTAMAPRFASAEHQFSTEKTSPIVGNTLTRLEIYKIIATEVAEEIMNKILSPEEINAPNGMNTINVTIILINLTEIIAYQLTKPKPSGLGNSSESGEFNDSFFKKIESIKNKMLTLSISNVHTEYWPEIQNEYSKVNYYFDQFINQYKSQYNENKTKISCLNYIHQIENLIQDTKYSRPLIRKLLKIVAKKTKSKIYISDDAFRKYFYETSYDEKISSTEIHLEFKTIDNKIITETEEGFVMEIVRTPKKKKGRQ